MVCDIEVKVVMEKFKVSCVVSWLEDSGYIEKLVNEDDCRLV